MKLYAFNIEQAGRYLWKTYKEIYEEVLHVGSALRQLGAEPVNSVILSLELKNV